MKQIAWITATWMFLLMNNAEAAIAMKEREHVQTFVWVLEAVTFVTIVAVFWFVWRLSKRERASRKSRQESLLE